MLVHRVNYVIGVREIVAGEILWPVFVSQGAELDDTVLSDALELRLRVVRVTKIFALSLANRLRNGTGEAPCCLALRLFVGDRIGPRRTQTAG